jgi:hypothetical protein
MHSENAWSRLGSALAVCPSFYGSLAASFLRASFFSRHLPVGPTVCCTLSASVYARCWLKSFCDPRHSSSSVLQQHGSRSLATRFARPSILFIILFLSPWLLAAYSTEARATIRTTFSSCRTERDPSVWPAFRLLRRWMDPSPIAFVSTGTVAALILCSFRAKRFSVSTPL